ncbi:MAG: hypothetical protein JWO68_2506 [Actinomycetia bacterium]|nr:hypothetical protein [Actinomycetes bacterium]
MADEPQERITQATKDAEHADAKADHGAPQVPTAAEADAAERHGEASPEAKEHYEEYLDKAANAKGEGRLP